MANVEPLALETRSGLWAQRRDPFWHLFGSDSSNGGFFVQLRWIHLFVHVRQIHTPARHLPHQRGICGTWRAVYLACRFRVVWPEFTVPSRWSDRRLDCQDKNTLVAREPAGTPSPEGLNRQVRWRLAGASAGTYDCRRPCPRHCGGSSAPLACLQGGAQIVSPKLRRPAHATPPAKASRSRGTVRCITLSNLDYSPIRH